MPFTHPDFEGVRQAVRSEMFSPETAIHLDDAAVDSLAAQMKAKLAKQRAKGYGGWNTEECTRQRLSDMLRGHVGKGDPVDVANFCAFLSARGEGISPDASLADAQAEIARLRGALEEINRTTFDDDANRIAHSALQK